MSQSRQALTRLLTLVALTELIYLIVFTLPFPLNKLYNIVPPLDYVKLTRYSVEGLFAFVGGILLLYGLYAWLLKSPSSLPSWLPYSGLVFSLTLFFSYPTLAIDLFVYALYSRGWGLYGLNPLATAPADLPPADQWIRLAAEWSEASSPYGPLWELLALGAFELSGGSFLTHLFLLKGIAILSYAAAIFLIGAILAELRPAWKIKGMLAFAWNPLVLLETAQNGHNDMLMAALLLAALWALVKEKDGWVMPLLALSVLVKFITILAAPFFLIYLALKRTKDREARQRTNIRHSQIRKFANSPFANSPFAIRKFAIHGLVFALLVILPMLLLWPGLDSWAVLGANSGAGRSALALMVLLLRPWLGINAAFSVSRFILYGLWAIIILTLMWQNRRRLTQISTLITLSWAAFFWYVLLAAPVFHAWYLLWFIPLAVLLPPNDRQARRRTKDEGQRTKDKGQRTKDAIRPFAHSPFAATLLFSFTALLAIPYFETIRVWFPVLLENHLLGHLIGVPLLLLPPALAAIGINVLELKFEA